jgi:hypothetical protein
LTLTGLAADSHLAAGTNPNAGRRMIAAAAMLIGALAGAVLVLRISVSAALGVAAVLLFLNAVAAQRLSSSTAAWTTAK